MSASGHGLLTNPALNWRMANYKRFRHPGGTYFFTVRLADRNSSLLTDRIATLRAATRKTRSHYPFTIDAIVVLPSAIHTIWTLPDDDTDFSKRWSYLKARFSKGLPAPDNRSATQIRRGEKGIWQRRFWEHLIRNEDDFAAHAQMIHSAPVMAGLAARPDEWPWSSIHRQHEKLSPPAYPVGYCTTPKPKRLLSPAPKAS